MNSEYVSLSLSLQHGLIRFELRVIYGFRCCELCLEDCAIVIAREQLVKSYRRLGEKWMISTDDGEFFLDQLQYQMYRPPRGPTDPPTRRQSLFVNRSFLTIDPRRPP